MRRLTLASALAVTLMSAPLSNAETHPTPQSSRFAAGISVGTPAVLNIAVQYSPHQSVLRLSGMYYGALRGAQISAIPYHLRTHSINLGATIGGGYAAFRHWGGPFSVVTDEVWYFSAGLSVTWRGAFLEPAVWWGRNTVPQDSGLLIQMGYLFAIN